MKVVHIESLIERGTFPKSAEWIAERARLHDAIRRVDWPPGTGRFVIYPHRHANGVKPIKDGLLLELAADGWVLEKAAKNTLGKKLGAFDAAKSLGDGPVVLEWETGNVSSSHRSLNKMAMLLSAGTIIAGTLVVPSRKLYKFLTDRIGNVNELEPYFPLWSGVPCKNGVFEIVVIEQDDTSETVKKIPKGTDGRSRR